MDTVVSVLGLAGFSFHLLSTVAGCIPQSILFGFVQMEKVMWPRGFVQHGCFAGRLISSVVIFVSQPAL
jgi:hypothetical protein